MRPVLLRSQSELVDKSQAKPKCFKLSDLFALPTRLMSPTCPRSTTPPCGLKRLIKMHTIERSYVGEVRLDDVLSGQHVPPLTAQDFEDYLVQVEHAPENLYFHSWLTHYKKKYRRWEATRQPSGSFSSSSLAPAETLPGELNKSLQRAIGIFMLGEPARRGLSNSKLELELNLTAEVKEQFKQESKVSGHPSIFDAVDKEVRNMLEESMRRWLIINLQKNKRSWRHPRLRTHRLCRILLN